MSQVVFPNGHTYDDTAGANGLAGGGHRTRFIPALADVVAVAVQVAADKVATGVSSGIATASQQVATDKAAAAVLSEQNARNAALSPTLQAYGENVVDLGNITGVVNLDCALGNIFTGTLTGNVTFTATNKNIIPRSTNLTLFLTQDATGGRTITDYAGANFGNVGKPALSLASKMDIIALSVVKGTTFIGQYCGGGY